MGAIQKGALSEHPEDRATRLAGEKYGKRCAKDFAERHAGQMALLIGTYADEDARRLLEGLREEFWAREYTAEGANVHTPEVRKRGPRR